MNGQQVIDISRIRKANLDAYNNRNLYLNHKYIEQNDLTDDIIELIKSCVKYEIFFRNCAEKSVKQTVNIDTDGRIKLIGMKGKCIKSDSIFHFSRLKYIIANGQDTMSKKAIQKIVSCRKKIKDIDIDHIDNNKLNNKLSNLQAIPHNINVNNLFDQLKKINLPENRQKFAEEKGCEHLLPFL